MNENSRYIVLILGAVVLMSIGLWGAYKWQQSRHITRESASLELHDMFDQSAFKSEPTPSKSDTIVADDKQAARDSLMKQQQQLQLAQRTVRMAAEKEGYFWQQSLSDFRFREPAEGCMPVLEEHAERLRDSLMVVYESYENIDSLQATYDRELQVWHDRLEQQVQMLPTAQQALEAEQITQDEYKKIISSIPAGKTK